MLLNRVGDAALVAAIAGAYTVFGSVDYATLSLLSPLLLDAFVVAGPCSCGALTAVGACTFFACCGKSAQLFLSA